MSTGVTCTVYVDGVRAADGSPGDNLADPIVLDELAVTWGRSDTMSQPDPDTCTFQVMDQLGGQAFLAQYRTGSRVDVVARGETWPDPNTSTFTNPGFELEDVTWATGGATATRANWRAAYGFYSLAVKPTDPAIEGSVLLAPGVFQEPETNPGAWDEIPTTSIGQRWGWSLDIWAPVGSSVAVQVTRFGGPYVDAAQLVGAPLVASGEGTWMTMGGDYIADLDDRWIGLTVTLYPTGPAWDEMPPTLTWDGVSPTIPWDDLGQMYIDEVLVKSPGVGTDRAVLVFSGRITDLSVAWSDDIASPIVEVACAGFTADLENRVIGDEPWAVETLDARAHRILALSGLPVAIDIDTSIDDVLMTWRDVDAQGATGLLQELAVSVDGVLWPAVHQSLGAYLRLEDPGMRASLLALTMVDGPPAEILHTNLATNPDTEAHGAAGVRRTNLAQNPRANTVGPIPVNTLGWQTRWYGTGAAGTFVAVTGATDGPLPGVTSYGRKTWTTAPTAPAGDAGFVHSNAYGTDAVLRTTGRPVAASTPHVFSAYLRMNRAAPVNFVISVVWRDATGAFLSQQNIATIPGLTANTWTRIAGAITSPATAAYAEVITTNTFSFAWQIGDQLDGTALMLEVAGSNTAALGYIDGALPPAGDFTYAWTGTPHLSTSTSRSDSAVGVAAYSGGNGVRWSSTVEHTRGARSFAVQRVLAGQTGFIWTTPTPLAIGEWITFRAKGKAPVGVQYVVTARTAGGGGTGNVTYNGTGAWQDIYMTALNTADTGTTQLIGAQLIVNTTGGIVYVDEVAMLVEPNPYDGPYFDGRTPSDDVHAYAWTGAEDASTSTWSTVQTHTIEIVESDPTTGFDLSACVVLRDPVTWVQTVADVVTRVAVTWLVQGVDEDGLPTTTESTVHDIDAGLELLYGTRNASVTTQLQDETDATDVAARILARTSPDDWRAEGLTIEDDDVESGADGVALMLDMLDGTSRIGAPIVLGDLPIWSPSGSRAGVYLEGGTYRYVSGRWVLELLVSSATGLGQSATWDALGPTWTWDQWSPAITWNDLRGVAAP